MFKLGRFWVSFGPRHARWQERIVVAAFFGVHIYSEHPLAWREKEPTPKQVRFLERWYGVVPRTRGECSDLIEVTLALGMCGDDDPLAWGS